MLDKLIEICHMADLKHTAAANELKGNQAAESAKAHKMRQQSVETWEKVEREGSGRKEERGQREEMTKRHTHFKRQNGNRHNNESIRAPVEEKRIRGKSNI